MKKYLGIFSAVFALTAISFSCQKAEITDPNAPGTEQTYNKVDVVLTATLESRIGTKVTLDFPNLAWEDQDQIAVFDGKNTAPNLFTYQAPVVEDETTEETNPEEVTPAAVAVKSSVVRPSFSGSIAESAEELYAVYPYNANATLADGKITTTIPHEQVVPTGGNIDKSALLCVAKTTSDALAFKNVLGLVKVTVPSSMNNKFKEFTIRGANEEDVIAGTGAITVSQTPVFEATDAKTEVKLTHKSGAFPKGDYYIAVAPVKFANGFSIAFTKADGLSEVKSTDKANEVARNSGLNVGDKLTEITWEYIIDSKEELVAWNNGYKGWTKNDRVQLTADIDLDGVSWTPHDFPGTFEGNNHKIYNITISRDGYCGFVAALNGTIQNLYLGTSDGEAYDGKSEYVYTPDATAGSWVHMGGVAASINNGALIKNVTNFVKISTPDSDGQAKVCMGGLVSMGTGTSEIQDCVNYGEIVCDASVGVVSGASNHQIGGIMCKTDGKVTITNCKNYGNIYAAGAYVDNVGGIMANPNGNATDKGENKTHIKGCYNYGNITITKTTSAVTPMALGGIVGKLTGATVENCHNEGNISSVCDVLTGIGGVVGIHKLDFESKITGCSNGVLNATDKGILSFNPEEGTQQMVIGGILGFSEDYTGKLTVQSCTNYAPISTSYNVMRNIGGIVGAVGKVTNKDGEKSSIELLIDKCHNYGTVTIAGTGSYNQRHIGGIAGMLYGSETGITVSNCTNNATLSTTATGGGEHRISGIVGHARYGKVAISACTNNGEVTASGTATNPRPAGIVSVAMDFTSLSIDGCYNKNRISNSSSTGTIYAGGIAAYLKKAQITDSHNNAVVEVTNGGGQVRVGGIAGYLVTSGKISGCTNTSTVECALPTAHSTTDSNDKVTHIENHIGGIVGYVESPVEITSCTNTSTATVSVAGMTNKPRIGGIAGIAKTSITSCYNEGKVTTSAKDNGAEAYVGGIAGWATTSTISQCQNKGTVNATACTKIPRVGGILGIPSTDVTIDQCRNATTGKVHCNVSAGTFYIGGIVCQTVATTIVQNCYNDGEVKISQKSYHSYLGGIVGLGKGVVKNCENTATGTVINNHTGSNSKYALAAGIVAKTDGAIEITSCKNRGTVKATVNTTNKLTGAGGIIGQPQGNGVNVVLKNNENHGSVIGENPNATARIYVGGIVATDGEDLNHNGASTVTGNINYGTVTLSAPTPAGNSEIVTTVSGAAAGGIFGLVVNSTMPTAESDYNINYGTVTAVKGDADGHAGALAGASSIAAWSGKVGKGTVVNGVAWSESVAAAWLCPSAVNALSATYVDAIQ